MKKKQLTQSFIIFLGIFISNFSINAQKKFTWVSTTENQAWVVRKNIPKATITPNQTIVLNPSEVLQTMEGFGTCFNEAGWFSLQLLPQKDQDYIFKELFAPNTGANLTLCRMPLGANDFSKDWYSFNETEGDFEMKNFSITNDLNSLVPYIHKAQSYNPKIKIWASPWSPPSWMKYNKHYAAKSLIKGVTNNESEEWGIYFAGINNGLPQDREGKEGQNMFIQEEPYFKAYAKYFGKFVSAYREQNINISMVMPQNEFNSAQPFPSCTWTAAGLNKFIKYLGPEMKAQNVDVFFGTMERPKFELVDSILTSPDGREYIKGVGFQWDGKGAIAKIHERYPNLKLYQSEQECGNGKNNWKYAKHTWDLMKHYIGNGASAYMYWNTSLLKGSISRWGWKQNSMISVDENTKTYQFNYDYYAFKHLSHFVKPGSKLLKASSEYKNVLAFITPENQVVIVIHNNQSQAVVMNVKVGNKSITPTLAADSFNTFLLK